jgi:predicted nucleic acid-binding protein
MFEQRALAITEDIMFKWRLLVEEGRKTGHTFSQPNLIIAATALHHGLTVGDPRCERLPKSARARAQSMGRSAAGGRSITTIPCLPHCP